MPEDRNIIREFISNFELFTFPLTTQTILHFRNIKSKLIIRIYRKDHELIDEKEISSNGDYAIFSKLRKKGFYLIELIDELAYCQKKIFLNR